MADERKKATKSQTRRAAATKGARPERRAGAGGRTPSRPPAPASLLTQLRRIEQDGGDGILLFGDGRTLAVSSLDKPFWPNEGLTKGDLMRYYTRVAPALLPAIDRRPLALKRYPNGIAGHSFFQQSPGDNPPESVHVELVETEDEGKQPRLVGGDLLTLLYTVQLGTIAVNAWHSRLGSLDFPDYTVLDLDPGPRVPFRRIIDVATWVRSELDAMGISAAVKTSGSRGLHVVVPLPPRTTYDDAAALAERVAVRVAEAHPREATVERTIAARPHGSVYVDHLQNARGKTLASVYSARAKPGATVSTPVTWRQLSAPSFDPFALTIETVPRRLARVDKGWREATAPGNDARAVREAARGG